MEGLVEFTSPKLLGEEKKRIGDPDTQKVKYTHTHTHRELERSLPREDRTSGIENSSWCFSAPRQDDLHLRSVGKVSSRSRDITFTRVLMYRVKSGRVSRTTSNLLRTMGLSPCFRFREKPLCVRCMNHAILLLPLRDIFRHFTR